MQRPIYQHFPERKEKDDPPLVKLGAFDSVADGSFVLDLDAYPAPPTNAGARNRLIVLGDGGTHSPWRRPIQLALDGRPGAEGLVTLGKAEQFTDGLIVLEFYAFPAPPSQPNGRHRMIVPAASAAPLPSQGPSAADIAAASASR